MCAKQSTPNEDGWNRNMVVPKQVRIALSIVSIAAAAVLLGILLSLSATPDEKLYRGADLRLSYFHDLTQAVRDSVDTSARHQIDGSAHLQTILLRGTEVTRQISADVESIHGQHSGLVGWQREVFHSFTDSAHDFSGALDERYQAMARSYVDYATNAQAFAAKQRDLVELKSRLRASREALVSRLRDSDRGALADQVFQLSQSALRRLDSTRSADVVASSTLDSLRSVGEALEPSFGSELTSLVDGIEAAGAQRDSLASVVAGLNPRPLQQRINALRDTVGAEHLAVLGTVNDARQLLNVYTVLLIAMLGYFGFRLSRSYRVLNLSHDDLEKRVHERTAVLENTLEELKESQVQLVQAEKLSSLGQLVAGVMHEINTPLLYVQSNAQATQQDIDELNRYVDATLPIFLAQSSLEAQQAMKKLLSARSEIDADGILESMREIITLSNDNISGLKDISALVQSLKDFSRLDRAAEDEYDINDGIERTLLITKNLLKTGITVQKDFAELPEIQCSPSRINQVFVNLITNAAQAMEGQGELKISTIRLRDWVEIVFEDNGCGIAEDDLGKIMDPFFTTKPVGEGTGLGLSIVHKIVEEHGGQIFFDSKPGVGTRVTIGLPIEGPAENPVSAPKNVEAA